MRSLVVQLNYKVVEDLLADLGYKEITIEDIMNPLREAVKTQPVSKKNRSRRHYFRVRT
jgi:(p)ppGpp synthase/HD superfamily hydrolase